MSDTPLVRTTAGLARGTTEGGLAVFRGIPYAAAPVGELRYQPPTPAPSWSGVRDATRFGPTAPQLGQPGGLFTTDLPSGEDCLTLNVWTPNAEADGLPVMVWLHGGAFLFGTGANPIIATGSFARDGVVFVSINYRLGSDGFLYTPGEIGAGNLGILDQIAALRWVRDNIRVFGGDPDQVTLAGQSAGATAVSTLLVVPSARGLFQRAIVQSSYSEPLLTPDSAELVAAEVYRRAGLPTGDIEALRALRENDGSRLLAIQMDLFRDVLAHRDEERFGSAVAQTVNPFQPVIDGVVVPGRPAETLNAATASVDLLIGHTTEEFGLIFGTGMLEPRPDRLAVVFEQTFPGRGADALAIYRSTFPDASDRDLLTTIESDRLYAIPSARLATAHAAQGGTNHFYRFGWRSPTFGAGHSVDIPFVFDALDVPKARQFTGPGAPAVLASQMHRAWLAFVVSGDPQHEDLPEWPAFTPDTRNVIEFGSICRRTNDLDPIHDQLWRYPSRLDGA